MHSFITSDEHPPIFDENAKDSISSQKSNSRDATTKKNRLLSGISFQAAVIANKASVVVKRSNNEK